jgi:hypothetical protein
MTVSSPAFTARTVPPKMSLDGAADVVISNIAQHSHLIATSVTDNGGYFYPVAGIASLAALILFLAPPLADE